MSNKKKSKKEIELEEQLEKERRDAENEITRLQHKVQGQKDKNSANIGYLALVIFCLVVILFGLA
jgi:Flp pilus assembly protein TadB